MRLGEQEGVDCPGGYFQALEPLELRCWHLAELAGEGAWQSAAP